MITRGSLKECVKCGEFANRIVSVHFGDKYTDLCLNCLSYAGEFLGFIVGLNSCGSKVAQEVHSKLELSYWQGVSAGRLEALSLMEVLKDACDERAERWQAEADRLQRALTASKKKTPGFVYLMHRDSDGCYKIGLSVDPDTRLKQIQADHPDAKLLCHFPCDDTRTAENHLHERYTEARQGITEWFSLSSDDVEWFKTISDFELGAFSFNGSTPAD